MPRTQEALWHGGQPAVLQAPFRVRTYVWTRGLRNSQISAMVPTGTVPKWKGADK
jgi:hypothetical protein